ncbi:MAG: hypothetical protein DRN57_04885 [Thermoplasmata archaeon]|nr:MAG: hypothetical protein DRN57_04885 [Thermoplasmata archaeon]
MKVPGRKVKKAVIIEEDDEEEDEIWDAVEWEEVGPAESDAVFNEELISDILRTSVDQAWEDGVISDDEMALLRVLKDRLGVDDDTFENIISERRPEEVVESIEEADIEEEGEGPEEVIEGEVMGGSVEYIRSEEELESRDAAAPGPPPKPPEMITLHHSVREEARPLDRSFDLSKKERETQLPTRRCPHCRSMIRIDPERGRTVCPVCGRNIAVDGKGGSSGLRKILDLAKKSYRMGDLETAGELYRAVLAQDPGNKEAQFYIRKMKAGRPKKSLITDSRNISCIETGSRRLDQLLGSGITMGDTVLIQGPPFCGKEILLDQLIASSLKKGVPVIYVSSNRAMKEVVKGIIKKVPQFKRFNREGLIRMYDLFSKHSDDRVLKEGHRIFNINDEEDFLRFQNDLVFVQEELVKTYHGGLLVINSLSPLISQVKGQDLMKFLQVLIARSKSYRFTNVLDIAAGVHSESTVNSVEYLMDGIIELREDEMKNTLRLKGFSRKVLSRDWVEYTVKDEMIHIVGSFMEERIL